MGRGGRVKGKRLMKPLPPLNAIRVVLCLRRYGHKDVNAATAVMALQLPAHLWNLVSFFFLCQTVLNHRDIKDGGVCSNVRFSFVFTLTECILTCICKTQQQIWPQRGPLFWICPLFKSAIQLLARGGWYLLALFEGVKILTTLWACKLWFFIKNTTIPTTKSKHKSKC